MTGSDTNPPSSHVNPDPSFAEPDELPAQRDQPQDEDVRGVSTSGDSQPLPNHEPTHEPPAVVVVNSDAGETIDQVAAQLVGRVLRKVVLEMNAEHGRSRTEVSLAGSVARE